MDAKTGLRRPALDPATVPPRTTSGYPTEAMRAVTNGRAKRPLGDTLGLTTFGVNLTRLEPGAASSLRHWHLRQDEFVWVLEGHVTLVTDEGEQVLGPGTCAGFPGGTPNGHHLVNDVGARGVPRGRRSPARRRRGLSGSRPPGAPDAGGLALPAQGRHAVRVT